MGLYDELKKRKRTRGYSRRSSYQAQGKFSGLGEQISSAFEDVGELVKWIAKYIGSVLDSA